MLWFLLGLLAATLVLLLLFVEQGQIFGFDADAFARVGALVAIALFVGGAFTHRRIPITDGIRNALIWAALAAMLVIGYNFFNAPPKPPETPGLDVRLPQTLV